ncbi:MAG: hypothetical protein ACJ74W_13360 [Pyrinomonadaceae bacterium]
MEQECTIETDGPVTQFTINIQGKTLLTISYSPESLPEILPVLRVSSRLLPQVKQEFEGLLQRWMLGAVSQLLLLSVGRLAKQPASAVNFIKALNDVRSLLQVARGKKSNLTADRSKELLERYEELLSIYKDVKKTHDATYKQFRPSRNKSVRDAWLPAWRQLGQMMYPDLPAKWISIFANADKHSAGEVARMHVAEEFNVAPNYFKKHLLSRLRRARKETSSPEGTLGAQDYVHRNASEAEDNKK